MNIESLTEREMAAYLIAYIEFSNNIALAMNDYPETEDIRTMLDGITAAWRTLHERRERIKREETK